VLKRVLLFLLVNILVILTISAIVNFFHLQPFLSSYGLDYRSLLVFCFIWGMVGAFISLMLSRMMAKWMLGVKLIDAHSSCDAHQRLYSMVERLARAAHLPTTPQVGVFESHLPNAFATGPTKKKSLVAVSSSLLATMSPAQLEAIIGHEISHIAHGDMVTMTLLQGVVNAFVMFLARALAWIFSGLGKNERGRHSSSSYMSYHLFVFVFELVFMVLGSMVVAYYSRRREFRADHGGASLSSRYHMISALRALEKCRQHNHLNEHKSVPALDAFMINSSSQSLVLKLLATHPPIEKRIEKLEHHQDLI
jgi:heat shock protein HtpX